ncbi:MAG: FixH family protein [Helicobacteraceae bacterium]|nr:FixH family protein [Helicobacteraceae bacterium]
MKTVLKLFMLVLLGVSLAQAAAFERVAKSSATDVVVSSQKPLSTGENTLQLKIQNPSYADATVAIKVFMPAMPGMPYMESTADAVDKGDGTFEADVNLSMGGTWQVHIFITTQDGQKLRLKTSLNI